MTSTQANGLSKHSDSKDEKQETKPNGLLPLCTRIHSWRWVTVLVTWFGFINVTLMGNSFNMALVCMTGSEPRTRTNDQFNISSRNDTNGTQPKSAQDGEFDWGEASQGILLSASMYVSFITPAISGFLARRFGPRKVVGFSITGRAILHLLTPWFARTHLYVLIAARVVQGGITNTLIPSTQGLWAHWAPDQEKVQITAWSQSGVNIGTLLASLVSGFLCLIPFDNGWPFVFYVFGVLSGVWCAAWWILVYDSPEDHRWIKQSEVIYIRDNIKTKPDKSTVVPYKAFLTSKPLFAYFVIQTVHKWCATIYFAYLPKYMRDVLGFTIDQNAIVSSVPFATRFIGVIFWGIMSDQMAKRKVSKTANRKIIQSTGFLGCAVLTTSLGFISEENRIAAVVVFMVTMFFQSCTFASAAVIPLDLAPKHSGMITGVYQSAGNIICMFGPITVAYMTPDGTLEQWRSVFYMITATYVVGVTFFLLTGSAELQPWGGTVDKESSIEARGNVPETAIVAKADCDMMKQSTNGDNEAVTTVNGVTKDGDTVMKSPFVNGVPISGCISDSTQRTRGDVSPPQPRAHIEDEIHQGERVTQSTSSPVIRATPVHVMGEVSTGGITNASFINDEDVRPFKTHQGGCSCSNKVNNEGASFGLECTCFDDVVNSTETQVTKL